MQQVSPLRTTLFGGFNCTEELLAPGGETAIVNKKIYIISTLENV